MADDKVAIWGDGLKFGRKTANGELLIGNGEGFTLATLTAGSGASISNTAGGITISATGSGGTVTSVTASSPISSSGGTTPNISLGTVGAANGGTGQTSLTANNVILGNGTSAVQFVAPGTSGNLLTSNGTTWTSAAPPVQWTRTVKSSDQSVTSNATTLVDVTDLSFAMSANKNYIVRGVIIVNHSSGGALISFDGPASPTQVNATAYTNTYTLNSISGLYATTIFSTSLTASQTWSIPLNFMIQNGSNAGDFKIQFRQNSSNALATTVRLGSWLEWMEMT